MGWVVHGMIGLELMDEGLTPTLPLLSYFLGQGASLGPRPPGQRKKRLQTKGSWLHCPSSPSHPQPPLSPPPGITKKKKIEAVICLVMVELVVGMGRTGWTTISSLIHH